MVFGVFFEGSLRKVINFEIFLFVFKGKSEFSG